MVAGPDEVFVCWIFFRRCVSDPLTHHHHHTLSPPDWDAGAEAPPDPTLWEADWDDDGVDDAFGKALADTLAQAQQQQAPPQQQAPAQPQ